MHPCRECGKPVEATAQFCPWCFALPGTADEARSRPEPVAAVVPVAAPVAPTVERAPEPPPWTASATPAPIPAPTPPAPPAPPTTTWGGTVDAPNRWSRLLLVGGVAALVVALVVAALVLRGGGGGTWSPQDALLRAEDLGSGWVAEGEESTTRVSPEDRQFTDCLGVPAVDPEATASSPSFARGATAVGAQVRRWADEAGARSELAHLRHPKFVECTERMLGSEVVAAEDPTSVPGVPGSQRVRMQVRIVPEAPAMAVDVVGAVQGDAGVSMFVMTPPGGDADDVTRRAMRAVLGRL